MNNDKSSGKYVDTGGNRCQRSAEYLESEKPLQVQTMSNSKNVSLAQMKLMSMKEAAKKRKEDKARRKELNKTLGLERQEQRKTLKRVASRCAQANERLSESQGRLREVRLVENLDWESIATCSSRSNNTRHPNGVSAGYPDRPALLNTNETRENVSPSAKSSACSSITLGRQSVRPERSTLQQLSGREIIRSSSKTAEQTALETSRKRIHASQRVPKKKIRFSPAQQSFSWLHRNRLMNKTSKKSDTASGLRSGKCRASLLRSNICFWKKMEGARIVDIGYFFAQLTCLSCNRPLDPRRMAGPELQRGLASEILLRCKSRGCRSVRKVNLSRQHKLKANGPPRSNLNTLSALAAMETGTGYQQMKTIFSCLSVPFYHETKYKDYEEEAGEVLTCLAEESCNRALAAEKAATIEKSLLLPASNHLTGDEHPFPIVGGYDGQYTKRGAARNSGTASGCFIGHETGKVLQYGVLNKYCRMCQTYESEGKDPPEHSCARNYAGASKGMESEIALDGVKRMLEKGFKMVKIVLDDDSSVKRKLEEMLPFMFEKIVDYIHARRNARQAMEALLPQYKHCFDRGSISHLSNCILKACIQCRDNPKELENRFKSIVPHMFGDHEHCTTWCRFKFPDDQSVVDQVIDTYSEKGEELHPNLRGGVALTDPKLREKLNAIFDDLARPERCMRLAPGGSTQRNESLHALFGLRLPKIKCFGMSGSANRRYAAGVLYWNEGPSYLLAALKRFGFNVSYHTEEHTSRKERRRVYHRLYKSALSQKRRRVGCQQAKKNMNKNVAVDFYESGLASALDESVDRKAVADVPPEVAGELEMAASSIQPRVEPPALNTSEIDNLLKEGLLLVFYDFETNSLSCPEPIEFGAVTSTGAFFRRYFIPTKKIEASATKVHHYILRNNQGELALYRWNDRMQTTSIRAGFSQFAELLQDELQSSNCSHLALIGHNSRRFDERILIDSLCSADVYTASVFEKAIFCDSLRAATSIWNRRKKKGNVVNFLSIEGAPTTNKQEDIYKFLFGEAQSGAHWALEDAQNLKMIFDRMRECFTGSDAEFFSKCCCMGWAERLVDYWAAKREREAKTELTSKWLVRVDNHIFLQAAGISKIVKRGLNLETLERVFEAHGRSGLVYFLCRVINAASIEDAHRIADFMFMRGKL